MKKTSLLKWLCVMTCGVCLSAYADMVLIPAGSFTMGDTFAEGAPNELPMHTVYISVFYMESTEVTKAKWNEVFTWAVSHGYAFDNAGSGKASDHPVHTVKWYDCIKWCNARSEKDGLTPCYYTSSSQTTVYRTGAVNISNECVKWNANGYRLPTEAEWEKAARGGTAGHRFPWSDADTITHSRANYYSTNTYAYDVSSTRGYHPTYNDGTTPYDSPVGSFAANGYGLYDMAGNVWEWCWDWYATDYYSSSPGSDPRGPSFGLNRVIRSGGWYDPAFGSRNARRAILIPGIEYNDVGLRCVRYQDMYPSLPSGVTASEGAYADKVLVYWTAVSAATNYNVWRGVDTNSQNASLLGTCTTAFYLDTSTTPDILYYYWIQAVNAAGTSELSVPDSGYCGSITSLTSPADVQASDGSYTDRIRITWQTVSGATRYEVWRNTGNDRSAANLISELTGTSYDDLSVAQGIYYYYWLKARDANRDGNFSESDAGYCRLTAPSRVSASDGSYSYHIRVEWNAVANATWYEVWREEVPGSNSDGGHLAKVAQTGELYFNDYRTKSGVYYHYKVKACNELCSSLDYAHDTGYRQVNAASTLLSAINDYDGDKLSDLALFNPLSGVFDVLCSALGRQTFVLGVERSQGVTGDYDGDRVADPVAYCPGSGTWLVRLSNIGYDPIIRVVFGEKGNDPVTADFDGDRLADIGIYNETDGVLSVILSNDGAFDIRVSCLIGGPGYRFVSADFDGDCKADPTVYSESESRVIIFFSGSGYFSVSVELGGQGISIYVADFDGDGLADPVLYEEATGIWTILLSSIGYCGVKILFGGPGYVPAIGDYDGDGLADPAIYREADGQWLITFSTGGYSVIAETSGGPEYQPMME